MVFEWDEKKREANVRLHGFDFRDAYLVFENFTYTEVDDRFDYDETRYYTIGILNGVAVVISHTETPTVIRAISFRKAEKYEEKHYYRTIRD